MRWTNMKTGMMVRTVHREFDSRTRRWLPGTAEVIMAQPYRSYIKWGRNGDKHWYYNKDIIGPCVHVPPPCLMEADRV